MFGKSKKEKDVEVLNEELDAKKEKKKKRLFGGKKDKKIKVDSIAVDEQTESEAEEDEAIFGTIWGGKLGDTDPRTKTSLRWYRIAIGLLCLGLVGLVFTINGYIQYHNYTVSNSTKFNTPLTFGKEQATVTLKGVYTDKDKEVTVVELGYSDLARSKLSAKGTNYGINLLVNSFSDVPKGTKISYGLLGTDGNGYLIINGKLKKEAYQFFILNRFSFDSGSTGSTITEGDKLDLEKTSVEKMISDVKLDKANGNGIFTNTNQTNTGKDTINFRINPYSDNTVTYNTSFKKDNGEVDYNKVVKTIGIDKIVKTLDTKIKLSKERQTAYSNAIEENTSRLLVNPEDSKAQTDLKTANDNYAKEKEAMAYYQQTKDELQKKTFDEKSFGIINKSYVVIQQQSNLSKIQTVKVKQGGAFRE